MNWIVKLFLGKAKESAIREAKNFKWSPREREILLLMGITEAEILSSEDANRIGLAAWVERQVK